MTRVGTVLSLPDPVLAELACQALDFAWIDLEHGALSTGDAQVLALAARAAGTRAYVRLPSCAPDALPAILDAGADGVVAPRVESAAGAAALVRRLRYPPAGSRGFGPRRAGDFGRAAGFAASARVECLVQIESPAGVAAAREIAAVDGVDALVLGCADLSFALGVPQRFDAPELALAGEEVADAAAAGGIAFGVAGPGDPQRLARLAGGRAELVVMGADVRLYAAGVDAPVRALRAALEAVRAPAWSLFAARTMQALELLALHPMSAPQVAEALQVHPRTARRLLARLTEEGWLSRSEDARRVYSPSMRVVALAGHVLQRSLLAEAAQPYVEAVNAEIGGPAHLVVPSYRWVLCIVHGADGEPARPGLRELAPCHATATGKALLAHRYAWRESVLDAPLERLTVRTLTDPVALRRDTDAAREEGYATEDGEWRAGTRAVAAPVFASSGEAVGALGASVPQGRTLEDAGRHIAATAQRLSDELRSARG